jgi:hypothetical protein
MLDKGVVLYEKAFKHLFEMILAKLKIDSIGSKKHSIKK